MRALEDLAEVEVSDLEAIGLPKIPIRRLMAAISQLKEREGLGHAAMIGGHAAPTLGNGPDVVHEDSSRRGSMASAGSSGSLVEMTRCSSGAHTGPVMIHNIRRVSVLPWLNGEQFVAGGHRHRKMSRLWGQAVAWCR